MNTKTIGDICELGSKFRLLTKGYSILTPVGDNQRYDYVLEANGEFRRVQVKSGIIKNGYIKFKTCSNKIAAGKNSSSHYKEDVDYFAVFVRETEKTYLVPVTDVPVSEGHLRLEKPKNNQSKRITNAEKYLIE